MMTLQSAYFDDDGRLYVVNIISCSFSDDDMRRRSRLEMKMRISLFAAKVQPSAGGSRQESMIFD